MINSRTILSKLLIISITALLLSACTNTQLANSGIQKSAVFFDTYVTITIYGLTNDDATTVLDECMNLCSKYEKLFSSSIQSSDIYNINHSDANTTKVSTETIELIQKALHYSNETNGLFDISIYGASKLWDFHEDSYTLPDEHDLNEAIKHINYNNIIIDTDDNTVTLTDPQTMLDIGGIAKGYIADCIANYINTTNATGAIINLGGDMMLIGTKQDNTAYTIGINDPFGQSTPIKTAKLSNKAIATSGTYIRSFKNDNKTFHHILNPQTGYPINSDIVSATIITEHSVDADTLCTISILMGSKNAVDYINSLPNTEAILVTNSGDIITSNGANKYLIPQ